MKEYQSPVYKIIAVPVEKVVANNYNPNVVAPPEMKLLELSIWEDGYTMPCVCYYLEEDDMNGRKDCCPSPSLKKISRTGWYLRSGITGPEELIM